MPAVRNLIDMGTTSPPSPSRALRTARTRVFAPSPLRRQMFQDPVQEEPSADLSYNSSNFKIVRLVVVRNMHGQVANVRRENGQLVLMDRPACVLEREHMRRLVLKISQRTLRRIADPTDRAWQMFREANRAEAGRRGLRLRRQLARDAKQAREISKRMNQEVGTELGNTKALDLLPADLWGTEQVVKDGRRLEPCSRQRSRDLKPLEARSPCMRRGQERAWQAGPWLQGEARENFPRTPRTLVLE